MPPAQLENDHNVYVLGAGFSVPAGQPVVANFLHRMRDAIDWLLEQERTQEVKAIEHVLAFRQASAAAAYRVQFEAENIEELFSLASAEPTSSLAKDMPTALAATIDFCAATRPEGHRLQFHIRTDQDESAQLHSTGWEQVSAESAGISADFNVYQTSLYQALVARMLGLCGPPRSITRNSFVTFNYDLVLETALLGCGRTVDYCIPKRRLAVAAPWIRGGLGVPVLKLHGSVNWAVPREHERRILTAFDTYSEVRNAGLSPVLVPPTWRKEFRTQLLDVWNAAVDALRCATRIVVVGFSIPPTDLYFRYLLAAGLRQNISLRKIVFIDPNVVALTERITGLLREDMVADKTLELVNGGVQCLLPGRSNAPPFEGNRLLESIGRGQSSALYGAEFCAAS